MTATSDTTIRYTRYGVRGAKPGSGEYYGAGSPLTIDASARGDGVLAVIQVQSSLYSEKVTCTIAIDGTVRTTRTAHGAFAVATCVA